MKDNIILIGFMGCGKSSVGIRLSYQLRRTMIDTDKWIEQRQKKTISQIFQESGEEAFRQMETECLKELIRTADRQIISVGGGLPMREENHELLKELGRVFYLSLGHHDDVFEKFPTAQTLMERGMLWAACGRQYALEQNLNTQPFENNAKMY